MTRPCSSRKRYTTGEVGIDPGRGRRWGCAVMLPLWSHPPTDGQSRASPHLRIRPDVTIRYPDVLGCAGTRRLLKGNSSVDLLQRSEEHTSELQSRENLVCRLLLEK